MKFRLRKDARLGALAAENDKELLSRVFVDLGYLDNLMDPSSPHFLILGRSGSGKTALIEMIRRRADHVSTLDPEELSMQHLHSSAVLRKLTASGIKLDIFYKYLWRHVCILELIRMRYGDEVDVPSKIYQLFPINLIRQDERKTRELSQEYLKKHGEDYWVRADTHIKNLTQEVEQRLSRDEAVGVWLGSPAIGVGARAGEKADLKMRETVQKEVVDRAQSIVRDYLVSDLNRVVDALCKYGFSDRQNPFYIVVDDLDKDWMPDDELYLDLLKSLLFTVAELNRRLEPVKIIVALRENIYQRIFQKAAHHEPQREKWSDVQINIRWTQKRLIEMVNNRLADLLQGQYTGASPNVFDLLPANEKKGKPALSFLLNRTLLRPRDVIDFLNQAIAGSSSLARLTWSDLLKTEVAYSQGRLNSVLDEWKDSYFGISVLFPVLSRIGPRFTFLDITIDDVLNAVCHDKAQTCPWLRELANQAMENQEIVRTEFLKALYLMGIIGLKNPNSHHIAYSFDEPFSDSKARDSSFVVHEMFRSALGIHEGGRSGAAW